MSFSHHNRVADARNVKLAIVAPDGRDDAAARLDLAAAETRSSSTRPGTTDVFRRRAAVLPDLADYAASSDYEAKLACDRTGLSLEKLAGKLEALIVTRGAEGSHIYAGGRRIDIPCVTARDVVDPTGCGDAYRAGLLYGIAHGWEWEKTGQLAAVMGAIKVAHRGGQNHSPSRGEIAGCFAAAFGKQPW
jgi:adenosine kinase